MRRTILKITIFEKSNLKKSLFDEGEIKKILQNIKPDEIYHLAAQVYDGYSFQNQLHTFNVNFNTTKLILSKLYLGPI